MYFQTTPLLQLRFCTFESGNDAFPNVIRVCVFYCRVPANAGEQSVREPGTEARCCGTAPSSGTAPLRADLLISLLLLCRYPCFLLEPLDSSCFRHHLWANMHGADIFSKYERESLELGKKKIGFILTLFL